MCSAGIDSKDPKERYHVIRSILLRLPFANRETVRILAGHLKLVAQHSALNKMSARNIELTWSLSVGAIVGAVMRVLVETDTQPPSSIVFGVPFVESCRNSEIADKPGPILVPAPISCALDYFRLHRRWSNDLFSKFSSSKVPAILRRNFNSGNHSFPDDAEFLDVATFVRDFVVAMPDSLFSETLHDSFGQVADLRTSEEQVARLRDLFAQLPPSYRHTLKAFTSLLADCVANSSSMSSFSVAFAFGDRYVDKIPLLIDNSAELFGAQNDITQLPWLDTSTAASGSPSALVSFSIGESAEPLNSSPASTTDTSTESSPPKQKDKKKDKTRNKGERRSRHAADSPGQPKPESKTSGKLKRTKSDPEASPAPLSPDLNGESSPQKPKRGHDKVKSEGVRRKIGSKGSDDGSTKRHGRSMTDISGASTELHADSPDSSPVRTKVKKSKSVAKSGDSEDEVVSKETKLVPKIADATGSGISSPSRSPAKRSKSKSKDQEAGNGGAVDSKTL